MHAHICRSRKGAYEVLEEVVLFAAGVVIMLGMVTLFNSVEKGMLSSLGESRMDATNKYVASLATTLKETNCTRCYIAVPIPGFIAGEKYTVTGSPLGKIVIYSSGKFIEENISVPAEGTVQSSYKSLQVEYSGNTNSIKVYGGLYY